MKIVSLVPSWTETLLACGVEVVGRTRFCIHPASQIKGIKVVGGTKEFSTAMNSLDCDFVLLDREENTLEMARAVEGAGLKSFVTHVRSVNDLPIELSRMASAFGEPRLGDLALRWERTLNQRRADPPPWARLPGLKEWLNHVPSGVQDSSKAPIVYVIWKEPWMSVSSGTFIASVFDLLGFSETRFWPQGQGLYPKFAVEDLPEDAVMLFSSEPFPFEKKKADLLRSASFSKFPLAIVDGEVFSWFGVRSLEFLENYFSKES
ncbi:MAG: helical backbone metal receptor [Bdellovibrionota bacterium]